MREIKFRVWSNFSGSYIDYAGTSEIAISIDTGKPVRAVPPHDLEELDDLIVEQFTGLLDKNGKEIFEGDIVCAISSGNKYLSQIIWVESDARFGAKSIPQIRIIKGKPILPLQTISYNLTLGCSVWSVIGNIHKNPELLP